MKEFWVNIFKIEFCSIEHKIKHKSREAAIRYSNEACTKSVYRIRVKMKSKTPKFDRAIYNEVLDSFRL